MAKVKEATKITKKPPKTAPKRPKQLSENVVVESDSEGSKTGSSSGHDVDSESDAEKRRNTKKPRLERVKETEPTEPPVPDDTSSEGESGSSDGESSSESESLPDAATPKKPTTVPAKVNGIKRKAEATKVNGTVSEKRARTGKLYPQFFSYSELSIECDMTLLSRVMIRDGASRFPKVPASCNGC